MLHLTFNNTEVRHGTGMSFTTNFHLLLLLLLQHNCFVGILLLLDILVIIRIGFPPRPRYHSTDTNYKWQFFRFNSEMLACTTENIRTREQLIFEAKKSRQQTNRQRGEEGEWNNGWLQQLDECAEVVNENSSWDTHTNTNRNR